MYKPYVVIPNVVPEKLCDEMVKESKHYSEQLAGVMWKDKPDLKKDRNSNIRFYPLDHWIVPKLCDLANTVNEEHYNFKVTNLQCPQFTEYKKGQHYKWHRDIYPPEKDGPYPGLVRKLSMCIQLSNFEDYKGGNFFIKDFNNKQHKPENFKNKGDLLVFPSFLLHQVTEVKGGKRYSLVCWFMGPPFQ